MEKLYRLPLFLCLFLTHSLLWSQDKFGAIKGTVEDGNGEVVLFANVYLEGTKIGTTTDQNGFFSITRIPEGSYTLVISSLEYETYKEKIEVKASDTWNKKIRLKKNVINLDGATITGTQEQDKREDVKISTLSVTPQQIKTVVAVGGEADFAQFLGTVAGVVSSGDQGGQLYIRGGPPIQNKVLMDGAIIYNPFHSIGLFSVFDTDILRNADVYTGGFGAQYGGRISSIMDITTRDGNKKRFAGKVGITPFTAKLILEGPIVKIKETSNTSVSYLLSGRGSYLEQSSKVFYPYADTNGIPYNFWDVFGKVSIHAGNNGSKISLFGFSNNDFVNYNEISRLNWRAAGGGVNFLAIPGEANVRIDGVFSYSNYKINLTEAAAPPRSSEINGFNLGINFHQFFGTDRITYGIEAMGFSTDFRFINAQQREIFQQENTTEFAAFVRYKFNKWGFVFDPSFRIHYYASLNEASFEPRLGIKYNVTEWMRLKLAGGMYSQNLIAANSDRDVVNLFYGFLSGSDNLPAEFKGDEVTSRLQKSQHAIFGMEFDLGKYVDLNVEGYYMNFSQLININRNKIYDDNGTNASIPDPLKKDFIIENGYATGVDATVKFEFKNFYIWAVYSLLKTERSDENTTYQPHFNRTHNINLVGAVKFGKKKDWEVNARWNFGSGFPFTQTQGFYEFLDFQGGINSDYTTGNGQLGIQYGEVNQGQLPSYHRFDVNIRKTFKLSERVKMELNAGATNMYNRANIFYVDRVTFQRVNQLPIMPTIGFNMDF